MTNNLFAVLEELESYRKLRDLLDGEKLKKLPITALAGGVIDSQKCHLACALSAALERPMLFVAPNELKAREIYQDLSFFFPGGIKFYPAKDILFYGADVNSAGISRGRFEVLAALLEGDPELRAVVCSVEALFDRLTRRDVFAAYVKNLHEGMTLEADALLESLVDMGYERADMVEGLGQFAARGGIIDLFCPTWQNPVRIELWGDEIDSLRTIDALTQRSVDKINEIRLYPAKELIYDAASAQRAAGLIQSEYDDLYEKYTKQGLTDEATALTEIVADARDRLLTRRPFPAAPQYANYLHPDKTTLLSYLPEDTLIFFDEPSRIEQTAQGRGAEFAESFKNRMEKGQMLPGQVDSLINYHEILSLSRGFSRVLLCSMTTTAQTAGFTADALFSFTVKSGMIIQNRVDLLIEDLRYYIESGYRVLILAGGAARMERLTRELSDAGLNCGQNAPISIWPGSLSKGFEYPLIRFALITGGDIFGAKQKTKPSRRKDGTPIASFADLTPGDYVVHNTHGIGIYRGIEKISSDEGDSQLRISRDYLKIAYADGGNLYVSAAGLDALQKYMGGDESKPKVHKLGGQEFAKAKARVRGAVAEIAKELTELYAKREAARGFAYGADTVWQREFEESFPYEETADQLSAVADIKGDMESGKIMDRLVCGDVGYGKTEVAIRAAFKTVTEGKQVAFLAPTTILAQQHYNTLLQRMRDFPITVDVMSRFRSAAAQRETVAKLATGAVDLVVGTHRLLSKDIAFKDLGLIIVDEEQRFGVAHKERLKQMRASVNVLTLTATPIPRTLHMSLTGIRDMSVLDEPPLERLPVQTYVMEYSAEAVRDAIYRELSRNGQVYYLHNRVRNIGETAVKIAQLAPEATIAVAHGQMSERELENVMMDFIQGDIDVLVCTTIIENGLDIPNANTLIVQDADYLGLSSLYQLRGRVGRSNRPAYCYLCYRKDKILTEASEKRLQIIRAFTEFGAGYKIALRDLSMRGAGNVLGAEQHGFMDAVGYEMYLKLLGEAVAAFKGEAVLRDFETQIDIPLDAYIPPRYIRNEAQKLDAYRKISQIHDAASYSDICDELTDRYGDPPPCVINLLDIAYLKAIAHRLDALSVTKKNAHLSVSFPPDARVSPEALAAAIARHKGRLTFTAAANPTLAYKPKDADKGHIELRLALEEL